MDDAIDNAANTNASSDPTTVALNMVDTFSSELQTAMNASAGSTPSFIASLNRAAAQQSVNVSNVQVDLTQSMVAINAMASTVQVIEVQYTRPPTPSPVAADDDETDSNEGSGTIILIAAVVAGGLVLFGAVGYYVAGTWRLKQNDFDTGEGKAVVPTMSTEMTTVQCDL